MWLKKFLKVEKVSCHWQGKSGTTKLEKSAKTKMTVISCFLKELEQIGKGLKESGNLSLMLAYKQTFFFKSKCARINIMVPASNKVWWLDAEM